MQQAGLAIVVNLHFADIRRLPIEAHALDGLAASVERQGPESDGLTDIADEAAGSDLHLRNLRKAVSQSFRFRDDQRGVRGPEKEGKQPPRKVKDRGSASAGTGRGRGSRFMGDL